MLLADTERGRMDRGSFAEQVLQRWIAQGAAGPVAGEPVAVQLDVSPAQVEITVPSGDGAAAPGSESGASSRITVRAPFSDGTTSDVSRYASFEWSTTTLATVDIEGRVRPESPGRGLLRVRYGDRLVVVPVRVDAKSTSGQEQAAQPTTFSPLTSLDRAALAEWLRLGIRPAEPVGDSQFLRRAYVQIIGRLPTPRDVRRFLGSRDPDKRTALIDELIARREFAGHWSLVWGTWLADEMKLENASPAWAVDRWLQAAMAEHRPLDRFVRELVLAEGDATELGPAAFFATCATPQQAAGRVARVVLGANLDCAECHSHPDTSFTRADFASLRDCFCGLRVESPPRQKDARTVRWDGRQAPLKAAAHTPSGRFSAMAQQADPRTAFADWLVGEGRIVLARNLVNRYWRHFFGRGLVEADADLRTSVEASMPEVLDLLAQDLIDHGFDGRHLVRTICASRLYQLGKADATTVAALARSLDTESFFASFQPQRIDTATLLIMVDQVTETEGALFGGARDERVPLWHWLWPNRRLYAAATSGPPREARQCPCDVEQQTPVSSLHLMSGTALAEAVSSPRGRVARLLASGYSDDRILGELYLATLARRPNKDEQEKITQHLAAEQAKAADPAARGAARRRAWEDVFWALLNSKEFLFSQ